MPVGLLLQATRLTAQAGAEAETLVSVHNPGTEGVQVRLVVSGPASSWASVSPADGWVGPGERAVSRVRFRVPRGPATAAGDIPFVVRVLSDQEGEGGAEAGGIVTVSGAAATAVRILPARLTGWFGAKAMVAVDNLGSTVEDVAVEVDAPTPLEVRLTPEQLSVAPGGTAMVDLRVRAHPPFLSSVQRTLVVRAEPRTSVRVAGEAHFVQRPVVLALGPVMAIVAVLALLISSIGGDDGAAGPPVSTSATSAPTTTTAPPSPTTEGAGVPGEPGPATPEPPELIAWQSARDGQLDIYTARPDGTDVRNITNAPGHDSDPAWSPDGTKLAFDSDRSGQGFDIYVMNADGSDVVQLTSEPAPDGYPAWSPDGERIAFVSFRDGNAEIYTMLADGSEQERLTRTPGDEGRPVWSPDGTRIAFHTDRDGNYEIYAMNADGSDPVNLTNNPSFDRNPSWSPNGARLAFDSTRDGGRPEIYLMGADGSLPTRLTTHPATDQWPAWSPDGTTLAFETDRDGDRELYLMTAGGGGLRRFTDAPGDDAQPAW